MAKPRFESLDLKTTSTKQASIRYAAATSGSPARAIEDSRRCNCLRLPAPNLPAPGHADQKADTKRQRDSRQRALRDGVFQRLLDRGRGVLGGVHHRAAALGHIV